MQCNKEDGTCDEMREAINWKTRMQPTEAARYKCTSATARHCIQPDMNRSAPTDIIDGAALIQPSNPLISG